MGFVSALRSALASVVKPLTGRKRKAGEDEDEEVAPPVPESASRPRLQHHRSTQQGEEMEVDPPHPQPQPQPQLPLPPGVARPLQQRLDFSSPAVAAQQRRGTATAVGALHPRSLHHERPPQLPVSGMAAAAAPPGSSGAPPAPASAAGPFSKRFAPPTIPRQTPAPRPYRGSLAANVRQVAEAPPSLTKMTLTPATARQQQQASQQQQQQQQQPPTGQRPWVPQQPLGALLGTFTGARGRTQSSGGGLAGRRHLWQQQPMLGAQRGGIEMQRVAHPADSSGGVDREEDAAVLRRAVEQRVAEEEQRERLLKQQQWQQQQQPEEVDLTGEPSSSQQPPAAGRPGGLGQAAAAVQLVRLDWREMLRALRERDDQEGLSNLDRDVAPARPPLQSPLYEAYQEKMRVAEQAKRRALEAQERGLQLAQQAHTQLERSQPLRAEQAEAQALQIQRQLHDMELQRRQDESRRRRQQAAQQVQQQQAQREAKPPAKAAPVAAEEEEEEIDLISSSEEEEEAPEVSVSMAAPAKEEGKEESEEEEEESEVSQQLEHMALRERALGPPAIPEEWREEYASALAPGPPGEVLVDHPRSNIQISRKDMGCMAHLQWLNDEVINLYISLLLERDTDRRKRGVGGPRCHFFSTFFTNKLYKDTGYNYDQVRRWTLPKRLASVGQASESILDCDRIIVPVHQGMHWVCAMVDLQNRRLVYYDSLKGEDRLCLQHLAEYVRDEYKNKRGEQRDDVLDWPREFPKQIPQQLNGCDCGVFTLLFANYAGRDAPLNFKQDHIDDFRVQIVHELLHMRVE